MYKLVAIDLDGTLLNSYGDITKRNENIIKEIISNGIEVVLTSGRTNSAIENFALQIGADRYLISGNGAVVYDLHDRKTIYNKYLSKEKVLLISKICEENTVYYNIYTEHSIITKSLNFNTLYYHSENKKKAESQRTQINIVENIPKYIEKMENSNFLKITVCDKDKTIFNGILTKLKENKQVDVLEVSHMSRKIVQFGTEEELIEYYYTEITNKNVNKWNALKFLADKLKIKQEEIMAIGDNVNDIEMIKNAGYGIAMGNSSPQVKKYAKEVTLTNDEEGVAEILKRHLNDFI